MKTSPRLTAEHLTSIRQNTDWRQLFQALHLDRDPRKSNDQDWWSKSPFQPDERTASFHINDRGWYCHSTGQGGGSIELVQRLHDGMTCYEAGRWLIDRGISLLVTGTRSEVAAVAPGAVEQESEPTNKPIRQDLRSQLNSTHPLFEARSIPPAVLEELGAGYLDRPVRQEKARNKINHRLVFQIRGVEAQEDGKLQPVILGHIGRATTTEQEEQDGKWWTFPTFHKSLELYNADGVLLDEEARRQANASGQVLLVEGCFDVAKLLAAGIRNVVAPFGSSLSEAQLQRLRFISKHLDVQRFLVWFDRDQAGQAGTQAAVDAINAVEGLSAQPFDWQQTWTTAQRGTVGIPETIGDPCDFSVEQLQWLRQQGVL